MSNHTKFAYDFVRQTTQSEPIKTGGIIINPEDALPSHRNEVHTDPKSHETYATLKPWAQIKQEQSGIVHYSMPLSEITNENISAPALRIDERPAVDASTQPTRVKSRQFNYEYSRANADEDPVKTGGIVINPQDVRSINRLDIQTDNISGLSYAMLKPWAQIQNEQAGIVHKPQLQEDGVKPTVDEIDRNHRRRTSYKELRHDTTSEPVKIGGILINPEDMLPSKYQELKQQEVGRDGSHYEIIHRPKKEIGRSEQRETKFVPSKPVDIEHIPGAHTTRVIRPEDMLPWMRDKAQDGQVPYAVREREFNYEISKSSEPEKIGGIVIRPEDALPSRRHEVEGRDTVQLHRRAVSAVRQRNSGAGYYEFSRGAVEEEPVKTGGIVINPKDVHSLHRLDVHVDPNSHLTYAQLKPWSKIQGEQSGVVHSDTAKTPRYAMTKKDLDFSRTTEREPVKGGKGTMLVNEEDMMPQRSSMSGIREFDLEFTRSSDTGLKEPIKGGKGTMLVNQEDMLHQNTSFTGQREFDFEYTRPVEREPVMGGKGTMLVSKEDMLPQSETGLHGIANFERLNPQTRELLNSHSRTKSLGYGMSSFQSSLPQSYLEPVKFSDYSGKQAVGSIDLPTQSTLTELDARIDSILNRSKNMLSANSVSSLTHLGEHPEPMNWGQTGFTGVGSYLGAY